MADDERRCSHTNLEQVYWSQFGTVKFEQRITDNSGNSLVLPRTFVENVRDKLVGNVNLRTASGSVWVIELDSRDERGVSLKGGWKKFFKAHCLKKNDNLSFSYHHNFNFDVTMFDGETGREKICGYFVKSETNLNNNEKETVSDDFKKLVRRGTKRTAQNLSDKEEEDYLDHFGSLNKGKKVSTNAKLDILQVLDKGKSSKRNVVKLEEEEESDHFDIKKKLDTNCKVSRGGKVGMDLDLEMERKERNLKRMIALAEREGDLVVRLQPSYVRKPWILAISGNWARQEGLHQRRQEIELHCAGKMWKGILGYRKVAADINGKCWKDFVMQNDLKVGDACLFSVVSGSSHPISISVSILRL